MGEIADMMLDGTMCECCGEFMDGGRDGPGFPRYCSPQCARDRGADWVDGATGRVQKPLAAPNINLGDRLRRTLDHCRMMSDSKTGMYRGETWDCAPSQYGRLERLGLVKVYHPHNPIHKTRAVITDAGRAYLLAHPVAARSAI